MSFKGSAFQKILTGLIIFNTVGLVGILGGGFYAYKYVTSDNFEKLIKNKVMGDIQNVLPKAIQSEIPDTTGISIPF
tara:strand:+ start:729 stop:959 length:231 start_codon:yes stop_codon:yes gene_type:complete